MQPSPECFASFTDLFEVSDKFDLILEPLPPGEAGLEMIQESAAASNLTFFYSVEKSATIIEPHYHLMSDVNVIVTFHHGVRSFHGIGCAYYLKRKASFLQSLVPSTIVREHTDYLYDQHFNGFEMIGVHIREHDERYDWAVVPPLKFHTDESDMANRDATKPNAGNFGESATVEDFIRVLLEMNNSLLSKRGMLKYFVSSNSIAVKQRILSALPSVVCIGEESERDSVAGMQTALMEMLLLSRSSVVIHTFGSTFAVEAAALGAIPLLGILDGVLLLHTDTSVVHCGLPLFAAEYTQHRIDDVYVESIPDGPDSDQRVIRSTAIAYGPCPALYQSSSSDKAAATALLAHPDTAAWGIQQTIWCFHEHLN